MNFEFAKMVFKFFLFHHSSFIIHHSRYAPLAAGGKKVSDLDSLDKSIRSRKVIK